MKLNKINYDNIQKLLNFASDFKIKCYKKYYPEIKKYKVLKNLIWNED